eukprot:gb/GECG01007032.1/.p1 GENE.gb/GECG01007032.1/~~gb/GECG01007032.1/.p1  ORF type:complete len:193 (+),score=14.02 gb/GECG01007032.1/:1-579(+)
MMRNYRILQTGCRQLLRTQVRTPFTLTPYASSHFPKNQFLRGVRGYHGIENNRLEASARVKIVPLFTDNYAYLLMDEANLVCAAVDPADADAFIHSALADSDRSELTTVLCTHKHWDHAGGNEQFAAQYKGIDIYGPATEDVPAVTHKVQEGDRFKIGGFTVDVFDAGCHTRVSHEIHVSLMQIREVHGEVP